MVAHTVFLTTPIEPSAPKPKTMYLGVDLKAYEFTAFNNYWVGAYGYREQDFKMLGDDYSGCIFNVYILDGGSSRSSCSAYYNLRGQYSTIRGTLGNAGPTNNCTGMFSIYLDNILYKEYPITGNMSTQEITIDVTGVQILKITVTETSDDSVSSSAVTCCGFGNVTIE